MGNWEESDARAGVNGPGTTGSTQMMHLGAAKGARGAGQGAESEGGLSNPSCVIHQRWLHEDHVRDFTRDHARTCAWAQAYLGAVRWW